MSDDGRIEVDETPIVVAKPRGNIWSYPTKNQHAAVKKLKPDHLILYRKNDSPVNFYCLFYGDAVKAAATLGTEPSYRYRNSDPLDREHFWGFPESKYSEILTTLKQAGHKLIIFDLHQWRGWVLK